VYGRYLGLERWDDRVHANNMYLEVLAGAGVPGLVALAWLIGVAGLLLLRRVLAVPLPHFMVSTVMLATWLMVAGHGLVDSFLTFTSCYAVFAIVAGLAFAPDIFLPTREADAHRI
jgi:O-antigen ligase